MTIELIEYVNYEPSMGRNCSDCRYGSINRYSGFGICYKFHTAIPSAYSRICDCIGDLYLNHIFPDNNIKIKIGY